MDRTGLQILGGGGTNYEGLTWGGSTLRSNPLPFYIPSFWQKRYPFYIPFLEKRHPFHILTLGSLVLISANRLSVWVFCFQITRGWVRGEKPAIVLVRSEFCILFCLTDLSPRAITWLNENSMVAHSNRKTWTTQAAISVKNLRIIAWKLTLE